MPPGAATLGRSPGSTTCGTRPRLDRQDLLLLRFQQVVDFLDIAVRKLLRLLKAASLVILVDRLVLEEFLQAVVALVAVAADLDARFLGHVMRFLGEILPAIFGQSGNRNPHELS